MIDRDGFLRCDGCMKALGRDLKGEVDIVCPRCKRHNHFVVDTPEYNVNKVLTTVR